MDIGTEIERITVEPLEDPIPREHPTPTERPEPSVTPEREPAHVELAHRTPTNA
jgi:hypothetical protein